MSKERGLSFILWTIVILLIASPSLFILYAVIEDNYTNPSDEEFIFPDPQEENVFFTYEVVNEINWTVEFTLRGPYTLLDPNVTNYLEIDYLNTLIVIEEKIFIHNFPSGGNYTLTLHVKDERQNGVKRFTQVIPLGKKWNFPPIPVIKDTNPTYYVNEQPVFFSAEGSYDEDGQVLFYYWDFCDGTHSNGSEGMNGFTTRMVTWHVFEDPSDYQAKLWVMDNEYRISVAPTEIKVRVLSG
jgi:PKD domain-containing protein